MAARRTLALTMLLLASLLFPATAQQTVKVADAPCAACHAAIYNHYLATPTANASGLAVDHLLPGNFNHASSGVTYTIEQKQHRAILGFTSTAKGQPTSGEHTLDYFLGSGHLGVTYLYTQNGYLLESPVAWYTATGGYDMKPGYGRLTEMPPAIPMEPTCLRCHMSGVARVQPGTINCYAGPPFQQTGITCESCHGDTSAHLRTRGKASVLNTGKLDPERRDSLCMSCHLEGDVTVSRPGRSALDYKPGDRISDDLSYFIVASNDPLSRGVSEVEQFNASRCRRISGDRMSCTTCHDPHSTPAPAERIAFYRARCLACHTGVAFTNLASPSAHHPENPDCTSCHMPRSTAQNIPHVAWTDHRILRQPGLPPAPADQKKEGALVAIFSPQATPRDAAVALYLAVMRGASSDRAGALISLRQVYAAGARDPQVLEALGVLTGLNGNAAESETTLRELLAVDPQNLTATADLGVLLARQGKLQAAVDLLQPAFAHNEDLIGLARNLAEAQCAVGDQAGAQKTIATALTYSPGVRAAQNFRCTSN